jgi:hypothetical protein
VVEPDATEIDDCIEQPARFSSTVAARLSRVQMAINTMTAHCEGPEVSRMADTLAARGVLD